MTYGIEINSVKVNYNDGNLIYLETRYYDVSKSKQNSFEISVQSVIDYWQRKTGIKLKDVVILGDYSYPLITFVGNVFTTSFYEKAKYKINIGFQQTCRLYFYGILDNNQSNYGITVLDKQINPIQFFKKHKCIKQASESKNTLSFKIPTEIKTQPSGFIANGSINVNIQHFWNNRLQTTDTYNANFNSIGIDYLPITTNSLFDNSTVTFIHQNEFSIKPLEVVYGSEFGAGRSETTITSQDIEVWILEQLPLNTGGGYGVKLNTINTSINDENIHFSIFNRLKHLRLPLKKTIGKYYLPKSVTVNRLIYTGIPLSKDDNGYHVEVTEYSIPTVDIIDIIYI